MQLLRIDKAKFPQDRLTPNDRDDDWRLAYARAAYSAYVNSASKIGFNSQTDYDTIRAYSRGKQSVAKYKECLSPGKDPNKNIMQVDWRVLPILSKFRRTAIGLVEKGQDYDIAINPVDALAKTELQDQLINAQGKILLREALKSQQVPEAQNALPLSQEIGEPDDLDGIEVMATGLRHRTAMEAEQVVELVFSQNKFEQIRKKYIEDLFDFGVAVVQDITDGPRVKIRNCDLRRVVLSYCTEADFSDLKYIGEIRYIPVSSLQAYTGEVLTVDELRDLYNKGRFFTWGPHNPFLFANTYDDWYLNGSVPILDLEIKSLDKLIYEERTDKRGNTKFGKTDKEGKNTTTKEVENIYCVKWLVGTDCVFGEKKKPKTKRDTANPSRAKFSYHIAATEVTDMEPFSRMENLMVYSDEIQYAWYKHQHTLKSAVPKGVSIDIAALEEVSLSAGGQKMTPKDILDLYFSRGVMVYRGKAATTGGYQTKWIEELTNGIGNDLAEYHNTILTYIDLIRQTLGLNELTDGSTPNPKLLTTVANLAASGTNNALSDLYDADRALCPDIAEAVVIRAQYMLKDGKGEAFIKALGQGTGTLLKLTPDIDRYTYGVTVEMKPTAAEQQFFEVALQTAVEREQITIDDYIKAKGISNLKQAQLFLSYKVRKNRELAQQNSMMLQEQNAQVQQQSSLAAEQAKQATMQMEYELKARLSAQENEQRLAQIDAEGQLRLEAERISASGRVEASFVQAKERQESNVRNNTTKLLNEDRDEKVGTINIKEELKSAVAPATSAEDPTLDINIPEGNFSFLGDR